MTAPKTAEEWGRLAVSLPGWRWMSGMQTGPRREDGEPDGAICLDPWRIGNDGVPGPYADDPAWEAWPDPDDSATAGCLLALAGAPHRLLPTVEAWLSGSPVEGIASLGRAVIADVRDQWARWPGGS